MLFLSKFNSLTGIAGSHYLCLREVSQINPFYRLHQLFRLAATELPRYSSLFSMMFVSSRALKPAISTFLFQ